MLVKPATVLLAAASASAFLIPPEISQSDIELVAPLVTAPNDGSESVDVKLNCPGCPVVIHGHRAPKFMEEKPHHLDIKLSVEHHPEGADRLLANGFELYPNPDPLREVFSATPLLDHPPWGAKGRGKWGPPWGKWGHHKDGEDHGHHRGPGGPFGRKFPQPQPLGFTLHTGSLVKEADSQLELLTVDLKIIEVGGEFINGIPELHMKLLKDASGRLMIGDVEKAEPEPQVVIPETREQCTTLLCKWMTSIFGSKKPCHGQRPDPAPAPEVYHGHGSEFPYPKVVSEPSRHMNSRPERSWGRLLKNIASHIILPVLIGIVAGVSVSLIGMVVGTLIVSAWRTFVRRPSHHHHHHRRHHSRKSVQMEPAVVEEKQTLMDNVEPEDAPPAYEVVKEADDQA
ncbi:hypothetical protein B0T16DRAFT_320270 [Cercophora newfieldiana]|uniref:DUF7728 domain-containing protein n=1 Tax=Cercophora newfieldiana TaxID=92897 RepID=A0AA39YPR7_9PEZI|nr:hypothetical protein B0T16DRAFT_320270 [Cercophora newfieldiana]